MELVQEIFVTVSVAILLSFLVAKLVSMALAGDGGREVELISGESIGTEAVAAPPAAVAMEEMKFGEKLSVGGSESETRVEFVEEETKKIDEFEFEGGKSVEVVDQNTEISRVGEVFVEECLLELQEEDLLKEGEGEEESEVVELPENFSAENSGEEVVVVMERAGEVIVEECSELQGNLLKEGEREEESEVVELTENSSAENSGEEVMVMERIGVVIIEECSAEMEEKSLNEKNGEEKSEAVELAENLLGGNSGEEVVVMERAGDCDLDKFKEGEVDKLCLESGNDVVDDQSEEVRVVRIEAIGEEDDDDWEGIERSELEEEFAAAAAFVVGGGWEKEGRLASVVDSDVQMQLYGLHKIATEGTCYEPQPMALKMSARAKWNAWQRQGNMSPEVAMEQYIALLSDRVPGWMKDDAPGESEKDILKAGIPIDVDPDSSTSLQHQTHSRNKREPDLNFGSEGVVTTGTSNSPSSDNE